MRRRGSCFILTFFILSAFIMSCASAKGHVVVTGEERSAIKRGDVEMYTTNNPPLNYRTIGKIEVLTDGKYTDSIEEASSINAEQLISSGLKRDGFGAALAGIGMVATLFSAGGKM